MILLIVIRLERGKFNEQATSARPDKELIKVEIRAKKFTKENSRKGLSIGMYSQEKRTILGKSRFRE
jgi:hypothetical protein